MPSLLQEFIHPMRFPPIFLSFSVLQIIWTTILILVALDTAFWPLHFPDFFLFSEARGESIVNIPCYLDYYPHFCWFYYLVFNNTFSGFVIRFMRYIYSQYTLNYLKYYPHSLVDHISNEFHRQWVLYNFDLLPNLRKALKITKWAHCNRVINYLPATLADHFYRTVNLILTECPINSDLVPKLRKSW